MHKRLKRYETVVFGKRLCYRIFMVIKIIGPITDFVRVLRLVQLFSSNQLDTRRRF